MKREKKLFLVSVSIHSDPFKPDQEVVKIFMLNSAEPTIVIRIIMKIMNNELL